MKTIYIVYKQHYDYGSQAENIKAFESKSRAEEYIYRLKEVFNKANIFYDELAGNPSFDEITLMDEDVWISYDIYQTKRNRYSGYTFSFEEIPVFDITMKMKFDFDRAMRNLSKMTTEEFQEIFKEIESTPEEENKTYLMYRIDATLFGGGLLAYYYNGIIRLDSAFESTEIYKTKNPIYDNVVYNNLNTLERITNSKEENVVEIIDTLVASTLLLLEKC